MGGRSKEKRKAAARERATAGGKESKSNTQDRNKASKASKWVLAMRNSHGQAEDSSEGR